MQRASGNRAQGVFVAANDGQKPLAVMRHAEAERLIRDWAAAELSEIRRCWYPAAAMGYRDYVAPRDPEERQDREIRRYERDWQELDRTGWVIMGLRPPHKATVLRYYRGGTQVGGRARNAALAAFASRWAIWSEMVDGPLNST
jgi:hypothetical protein